MSGGQVLKIALARTFYSDATILVLDESNNSLDTKLEHEILKFIKIKSYNYTLIIIAHQSKSLNICNKILNIQYIFFNSERFLIFTIFLSIILP